MKDGGVAVKINAPVTSVLKRDETIVSAVLGNGTVISAKIFALATGGKSRPETGSTGDGFNWLAKLGHTVSMSNAALVPISVNDTWVKRLAGVSLKDVRVTVIQSSEKQESLVGKILFTHEGLSGPAILNLSRSIGELLEYAPVNLELDLLPELGYEKVNDALQILLKTHHTKMIRNALRDLVPSSLVSVMLELANINPETVCNSVTRKHRVALMKLLKHI